MPWRPSREWRATAGSACSLNEQNAIQSSARATVPDVFRCWGNDSALVQLSAGAEVLVGALK